jgi:hypothetical protein
MVYFVFMFEGYITFISWKFISAIVDDRESNIFRDVFPFSWRGLCCGLSEYNLVLDCAYRLVGCFESWCRVLFALLRRLCSPATRNYSIND